MNFSQMMKQRRAELGITQLNLAEISGLGICILLLMLFSNTALRAQDTPSDMSEYRGQDGASFLFYVTGDDQGPCWGGKDNIYTDESPLAVAAVHAGLLKANETKLVKVKVLASGNNYPSINRNGIVSEQSESSDGSYQLLPPSLNEFANAPTNMSAFTGKYDIIFLFRVTGSKEGAIWGGKDGVYTTDSEIATAAVHAGVLKLGQTGIVRIKVLPGRSSYPEFTRNAITSHGFDEWEGSYQFIKNETP